MASEQWAESKTNLLSPIHTLSEDVLLYIFRFCQWNDDPNGYIKVAEINLPTVVVLSHVCSAWRKVALSCSGLWSRISIETSVEHGFMNDNMAGILSETCITRSREAPLHIFLFEGELPDSMYADSCIRAMSESAHRWETFVTGHHDHLELVLKDIPETATFSLLKKLTLYHNDRPIRLPPTPVLTYLMVYNILLEDSMVAFASAPLLSHFEVHRFDYYVLESDFPWSQITRFTSGLQVYYGKDGFRCILQLMPNLVFLDLNTTFLPTTQETTLLLNLKELMIEGKYPSRALNSLTTPNLKTLTLRSETSQEALQDYLARSGCNKEELTILQPAIEA